jgi:hypothetical protein
MSGGKREGKEKVLNNASFLPILFFHLVLFIIFFFFYSSVFFYFLFCYFFFFPTRCFFSPERMQIGFTKKGLRGGRPSNLESNYIIPQCAVCVSNGEPHQTKQTPIIYQRASQKKKLNKENRNEEEKSSTKKKEKKMVDSVNIDTGRDVYTVGLGMNKGPVQFPAGFQKGTHNTEPTHTDKSSRKRKKNREN